MAGKGRSGFTYAEVVMALAVLCVLLVPVFPAMSLAARHIETTRAHYRAQLFANELATAAVRGLTAKLPPELDALAYTYGCWMAGGGAEPVPVALSSAMITADDAFRLQEGTLHRMMVAVVWDGNGHPAGRAVRLLP